MKRVFLKCPSCSGGFQKPQKEYDRQRKSRPLYVFYCSRSCSGKSHINLAALARTRHFDSEVQARATAAASIANTKYTDNERPFLPFLKGIKGRLQGVDSDIDLEFLKQLWETQEGKCAISRIPLELGSKNKTYAASLDRIKSSKGYSKDNVQFVSCRINWAKSASSDQEAHEFLRIVVDHYQQR